MIRYINKEHQQDIVDKWSYLSTTKDIGKINLVLNQTNKEDLKLLILHQLHLTPQIIERGDNS